MPDGVALFVCKKRIMVSNVLNMYNGTKGGEIMRTPKYHLYLNNTAYKEIMEALIMKKNELIATGHYTDAIDEILIDLSRAKPKNIKVIYTG